MENKKNIPSSFIEYDTEEDDITILRVPPPNPPQGENPPPEDEPGKPQEPQEVPENVENPFEEEQDKDNKDQDNKDQESKDQESKDQEGKDQEGKDQDGKDGKNGEGENGEGENGEDEDSEKGDFGNKADDEGLDLDELLKKIKDEFSKGKSSNQIQNDMGFNAIEEALSTPKDSIKSVFKSKQLAKAAIGNRNLFGADNEQKINDLLNEIFK
jgi:type IV secretory pathway VirB10-like protein